MQNRAMPSNELACFLMAPEVLAVVASEQFRDSTLIFGETEKERRDWGERGTEEGDDR